MDARAVFRDEITELREGYHVTYRPADVSSPFAVILLTFHGLEPEPSRVAAAMETELKHWLQRYAVPAMVSSFDPKDDLIRLSDKSEESHLMGFICHDNGQVTQKWGLVKADEMPSEQQETDYLEQIYRDVPFRLQADVRRKALQDARSLARTISVVVGLIVVVPLVIEIISLGVSWVGWIVSAVSICTGLYKAAKLFGFRRPTRRERDEAEKEARMQHYYYHCERNSAGFTRLKVENLERDAIERTAKEVEALSAKSKR